MVRALLVESLSWPEGIEPVLSGFSASQCLPFCDSAGSQHVDSWLCGTVFSTLFRHVIALQMAALALVLAGSHCSEPCALAVVAAVAAACYLTFQPPAFSPAKK